MDIVAPSKKYNPSLGDFIYGDDAMLGMFNKQMLNENLLLLTYVSPNTWSALKELGVSNAKEVMSGFMYECPYTGTPYCGVIPVAIATKNELDSYFPEARKPWYFDMMNDREWNDNHYPIKPNDIVKSLGGVMRHFMGCGYTDFCGINDGSYGFEMSTLELDNGDVVLCANLVWYNK